MHFWSVKSKISCYLEKKSIQAQLFLSNDDDEANIFL